jgi:hypothetical protein
VNHAVLQQYFERADWALCSAMNAPLPLNVKSHLIVMALHACQSLKESLDQFAEDVSEDMQLTAAIKDLPHTELIENVHNMDLHGRPIPICDPNKRIVKIVTKPDRPIKLSSPDDVAVALQLHGPTPRVLRSRKDLKHAKAAFGGATVSFECNQGSLIVHDFSTDKDHFLLDVLRDFLERCRPLIRGGLPGAEQ